MSKKILFFLSTLILISCNNLDQNESNSTWIGGQIVNPKGDYVLLYKEEKLIDSVKLNRNNNFIYKSDSLTEGLYSFRHYEYQVFYITPKDSLMIRVNTIDFDESLSYSGIGAEKNNFIMDMFLLNEKEIDILPQLYTLSPVAFEKQIDSFKNIRLKIYHNFKVKNNPDSTFTKVAEASINYDYYSKKELYTSVNLNKKDSLFYEDLTEGFFDYRNDIDFGSELLRSYFPYYRFLYRYFDNITFQKYKKSGHYNRYSFSHQYNKLIIIDSLVTNDSLQNNLVKNIAHKYLMDCNNSKNQEKMLRLFQKINTNENHQDFITHLAKASMNLTAGNKIPNLLLASADQTIKDLHSLITQPTVVFLWSSNSIKHYKEAHTRAVLLRNKYPNFNFLAINTDKQYNNWISIVNKFEYNPSFEFQFENIEEAEKKLVINSINKAFIVNKDGTIIDGNTNLFNPKIGAILKKY
ncbi:MAG: hypothetical protein ACI9SJ_001975 [Flavobacteriaceae bacterium]|jgi:hypothetical protein|uniref:TlpA family protein disulfide reductase n=1 Tax=Candidatus Marifrigoribacter sp. Uisw_064 TaxID=3230970 RepID=UPI003AE723C1